MPIEVKLEAVELALARTLALKAEPRPEPEPEAESAMEGPVDRLAIEDVEGARRGGRA